MVLPIFGLGRSLKRKTYVKHNIKTIDRLFENQKLVLGRSKFYEDCVRWVIGSNKQPLIIIDWSGLTRCGEYHFLRASVPVGGRALPILDMAFSLKNYMKQSSHELFIKQLKSILPHDCKPIIITDAGFRCPWFKLMLTMKWDFIGRVRNVTQYQNNINSKWEPVKSLYTQE